MAALAMQYRAQGVPVLVIMKNDEAAEALQREHLAPRLQADGGEVSSRHTRTLG